MRHALSIATAALLFVGCTTTKQAQVRTALTDAGLPPSVAACMAEPMGEELSVNQLKSLQRVAKLAKTAPADLTQRQVMDLLQRELDPQTVGVVLRAGVGCFLRG
jgi:hypothetical protein